MIITQTPHRVSFFGGGTDYPVYYRKFGGKTLGTAIDKYCYLSIRKLPPYFNHRHRIVYSKQENVNDFDEIEHPAVRSTLKYLNVDHGVSIHHDGDIPARSGMGSSSAFTTGLVNGLYALAGKMISRQDLMLETLHIEQNIIKENVGSQDQAFASYGGLNLIEFFQNGEISVNPIILPASRLDAFEKHFMLFFTGISRISSEVAKEQIDGMENNYETLDKMKTVVDDAVNLITSSGSLSDFGELLHQSWLLKKSLSNRITNKVVDNMYQQARDVGALGGKLLGAGGGGFLLLYVAPERRPAVKAALADYLHIPFTFDFTGSRIIVYKPNGQ